MSLKRHLKSKGYATEQKALTMSARLRADLDRNRRAAWARRIAADQRLEARRAAAILESITRQIRSIPSPGRVKLAPVASLQGTGVVTAILPNGRRIRMRIIPAMALIREVNRLRSAQAVALSKSSRAIASLAEAQATAFERLAAEQVKRDEDLRKRLVEADDRLNRRITKELKRGTRWLR